MTGTCSTWRCVDCGEVWTWRNTAESARCTAEVARHHRLVEVAPCAAGSCGEGNHYRCATLLRDELQKCM